MESGALRHKVTIYAPPETERGSLEKDLTKWTRVGVCHAKVADIRGRELWEAEQAQSVITHRITMRKQPYEIKAGYRVKFGEGVYHVETRLYPDTARVWLVLMCREVN